MSNFITSDMPGVKNEMGFGATLGGFAKFDITDHFALQPEILVHYQNSRTKDNGKKRDFEYWGMEIPVYALGQWNNHSGGRWYAGLGPYVGLGFDAKYKNPKEKLYKEDVLQPWDFGGKAMIGYEFANGIQVNAGYKIGLINAVDKGKGKMLPQAVSLGVGYRF